jgi:predicted nucleotidyltransferase
LKYKIEELAEVIKTLEEEGVQAVIIGDTSIQLALGFNELEGDLDLFVLNPSPVAEKDFFNQLADKNNWEISTTEVGTPSIIISVSEGHLVVELYENYMDIDIPLEILEDIVEYRLAGTRIKAIKPEYYIVLKARQGVDLDKLKKYVAYLKQKGLNLKLIEYALSLYPEDEKELIQDRLRSIGLETL